MQKDGTQLVKMHVSDGEGAIYLVSAVQLAMTSQRAHLFMAALLHLVPSPCC